MSEEKKKYLSGIYGKAEVRFGGKIYIEPVSFIAQDGLKRHGLALSEFYNVSEVGTIPTDQRTHEVQVQLVFDNIKSVEAMEAALATVREMLKRDAEKQDVSQDAPKKNPQDIEVLLDQRLENMNLKIRTINVLQAENIVTVRDLVRLNKTDILKLRNSGRKTFWELDDFFKEHNLYWGMKV